MKHGWTLRSTPLMAVALLLVLPEPRVAFAGDPRPAKPPPLLKPSLAPGGEMFDEPTVLDFRLHLRATNFHALRESPREYTPITVVVNGQVFTNVGAKLKGAAGSFRTVDDQPALTLHFSKWVEGRRLFGIRRLHLNNSVQDPSYLNEYLGSGLFRATGVPTPRVAWATVAMNDRKLGLYVLKEAFEKEFLRTYFGNSTGNLYDGGFVQDIHQDLERESGEGPDDHSDLKGLVAATEERDRARRWERLQQVLDVDRFATYAALSVMMSDWDGYALNRNNYRIYFRPDDRRAVFLPHGMDQLFQRSYFELDANWSGSVAWALFDTPPGQALYEARCRHVFTNVLRLDLITNAISRACAAIEPVQPDIRQRAADLEDAIRNRLRVLRRDPLLKPPPAPKPVPTPAAAQAPAPQPSFRPGDWRKQSDGEARLDGPIENEGRRVLGIAASGHSTASWRSDVSLKPGRYRFEGRVRTNGVEAVRDDKGEGAGLRVSGGAAPRANKLEGDRTWTPLSYEFEVPPGEATVTLVCELRASRGQAWFELESLQVVPLGGSGQSKP